MGTPLEVSLLAVAGLFAIFNGANDGGALLATTLKMATLRPLTAALLLAVTVGIAPAVFGVQVARTLGERLVSFQGSDGQVALLIAVVSATAVVMGLSRRGLPTSLTLSLIGGIVGVGVGGRLPVAWGWVWLVLVLGAAAPLVGLVGAFVVSRLWRALPLPAQVGTQVRHAHRVGFALQAFTYGANDGQKMLAVLALSAPAGIGTAGITAQAWMLLTVGALFFVGTLAGARRYGARLGSSVLPVTPINAVTAQYASTAAVMGSAAAGAPVSMTQSVTGGLVGSGLTEGVGRIRWQHVGGLVAAWALTLPAAALSAGLLALLWIH